MSAWIDTGSISQRKEKEHEEELDEDMLSSGMFPRKKSGNQEVNGEVNNKEGNQFDDLEELEAAKVGCTLCALD